MRPPLNLVILTDVATLEKAPLFFVLYGLTMRASGADLLVTSRGGDPAVQAAGKLRYPFSSVRVPPADVVRGSKQVYQEWKRQLALELLATKRVIWPDVEFSDWKAESVDGIEGLVILDFSKLLRQSQVSRMGGSL